MPCRPINMESFGHKMFISSQRLLQQDRESCILTCEILNFHEMNYFGIKILSHYLEGWD